MADASDVLGIVGTATAINAVSAAGKGKPESVFGIVFGGIAMFSTLAGLGQFYDWRLARNFAWLFLLGTLLFRGQAFFDWLELALSSTGTPAVTFTSQSGSDTSARLNYGYAKNRAPVGPNNTVRLPGGAVGN